MTTKSVDQALDSTAGPKKTGDERKRVLVRKHFHSFGDHICADPIPVDGQAAGPRRGRFATTARVVREQFAGLWRDLR